MPYFMAGIRLRPGDFAVVACPISDLVEKKTPTVASVFSA